MRVFGGNWGQVLLGKAGLVTCQSDLPSKVSRVIC